MLILRTMVIVMVAVNAFDERGNEWSPYESSRKYFVSHKHNIVKIVTICVIMYADTLFQSVYN
jgi:hypothetical protein